MKEKMLLFFFLRDATWKGKNVFPFSSTRDIGLQHVEAHVYFHELCLSQIEKVFFSFTSATDMIFVEAHIFFHECALGKEKMCYFHKKEKNMFFLPEEAHIFFHGRHRDLLFMKAHICFRGKLNYVSQK